MKDNATMPLGRKAQARADWPTTPEAGTRPGMRPGEPGARTPGQIGKGRSPGEGAGRGAGRARGGRGQPQGPAWPIVRRLLGYMRPHALLITGVLLALSASTAMELAPPWIIRYAIDDVIPTGQVRAVWLAAGAIVGVSLVQGLLDFLRLYLMAYTGQRIIFGIRNSVFEHLSRLSFSFYDRARTGDLMSRVTADVDALSQFYSRSAVIVVTNLLTILGILAIMAVWSWRLALLYLLMIPLMAHSIWVYARRVRPAFAMTRRSLAALNATLRESLVGIQVVKLFGGESRAYRQANVQAARVTSFWMPYTEALLGAFTGAILWYGGREVIAGAVSLGMLVGFTSYIAMLFRPIRQTGMMLAATLQAVAAAERVFEVLDTEPEIKDAPDAYPLPRPEGWVRFERVSFSYDAEHRVLDGASLEAKPGQMVALVGPSGAGKTSLVHLIPRFYDLQEGAVTIDGHDVRSVTLKSLREAVGVAMQDVFIFDASIGENIAYGNPAASQADIETAARMVQLHDFVASLPLGYGTPVGERGVRLSGGQKQRLALARVLLKDSPILIFDEPTSSVDAATERQMQEALDEVRRGRTTFVIAHRLWTVQRADQILVLADGHIVERAESRDGRSAHETLLASDGPYSELVRLQLRGEVLAERPEEVRP